MASEKPVPTIDTHKLTESMRFKALLLTEDGGKTWRVFRQYYLTDLVSNEFLNVCLQGKRLRTIEEEVDDDNAT